MRPLTRLAVDLAHLRPPFHLALAGLLGALAHALTPTPAAAGVTVKRLTCEYKVDPLGIDVAKPRLAWVLEGDRRGEGQTAYQILVASTPETLRADRGDCWDSGKVAGDASVGVEYAGPELASGQICHWKVRAWDRDGTASAYSAPAAWEMGLLRPADWKARWVEAPPPEARGELSFRGASWVWFPEGDPAVSAPAGERYFRRAFVLPAGKVTRATLALTADDAFTLFVNGKEVARSLDVVDEWKQPRQVDVTPLLHDAEAGPNVLAVAAVNRPSRGQDTPAGLLARLAVSVEGGKKVDLVSDKNWKVSRDKAAGWEGTAFDDSGWAAAKEVAPFGQGPWGNNVGGGAAVSPHNPPPYFRKAFPLAKEVRRARLYVSALGLYEARLNGRRVGDAFLAPDWTDYRRRVGYQAYDVTALLAKGENVLGAILGDGWYCGHVGLTAGHVYGARPALLAQLAVQYADGSADLFATDGGWKSAEGPMLLSDLLDGEDYDARRELAGWDAAGYDDSAWKPAHARPEDVKLEAQIAPPVRRVRELPVKAVVSAKPGRMILDLGQNMVGFVRLSVKGDAGAKLTLHYAEMLNPDGSVYLTNLRGARATDTYTLKGGGAAETWEPRFTFHGFRYVRIDSAGGNVTLGAGDVSGVVIQSDTPPAGTWECSDARLNQLQSNIVWGQRGNFVSVPTDCPQRDERLGWMGDAQVFARTATFNMDVNAFFSKWLVDVADAQSPAGAYTDVSPRVCCGDGTAAWADAGVICPWTMYQAYGDTRLLRRQYNSMAKYIQYLQANSKGLIRLATGYGDWLSIAADTPKDVLATAYFAYSTDLMARIARALGMEGEARKYDQLFRQIRAAFNQAFVGPDGRIKGNTQTCYLLALRFNLLDEARQKQAVQYLVDDIRAKGWHLSTGFVGVSYLLPTLTRHGHLDVAYRLLNQDTFPSWLFSVKHGATTIWERWDGWTPEHGFQDPGMNSFNHYSLGSCGEWMYDTVAGLSADPDRPGYKHLLVRPRPGGGLTFAKASYESVHGRVATDWKEEGGHLTLAVTVPANTTATVYVPADAGTPVSEGGKPAEAAEGVKFVREESGASVYEVGSGDYRFTSTYTPGDAK